MDPISAIFVMVVLAGAFAKGVDVATDGLLSAEVGGGVRGVSHYAVQAGRARWRLANAKAREIRMASPQGRKVQELLDLAGMFVRVLSAEAVRFGSGARSGWEKGRDQARSARTKRRGDAPWPVTEWVRERLVRLQESRTKTPNESEPSACSRCGRTEREGELFGGYYAIGDVRLCDECVAWLNRRYPDGWPDDPNEVTGFGQGQRRPETMPNPNQAPFGGPAVVRPFGSESDDLGPLPPKCPDCGMPIVLPNGLNDHRLGRDRCPYATDLNGDPNVPLDTTVPDENGNVKCGCCAQLHKPLEPGAHCPDCHIHDHPSQIPNGPIPNAPATRGPSMDVNSAPAAIAAAEAFGDRFESLQSRADSLAAEWDTLKNDADTLHGEIATLMDSMGDFAIGGEADTAASVGELSESATSAKEQADNVVTSLTTAKEAHAAYVGNLHLEYDASIEAAAGKVADAHSVMQEA